MPQPALWSALVQSDTLVLSKRKVKVIKEGDSSILFITSMQLCGLPY